MHSTPITVSGGESIAAYTAAGVATAALVGGVLGIIGQVMHLSKQPTVYLLIAISATLLAARELLWYRCALPQVHRQTQKMWAFEFGIVPGAAMWGAHIGFGYYRDLSV